MAAGKAPRWSACIASTTTASSVGSDEDDVVLLLRVRGLDLHRDRLRDEVAELREAVGLLVEEEVDHLLGSEDAVFLRAELPLAPQDLAQDLVAHGLRGLERAAAVAHGTGFAEDMRQRFPGPFAR